jgi:hypothetical protein
MIDSISTQVFAAQAFGESDSISLTPTSLQIKADLGYDRFIELGQKLRSVHGASSWWIADYIVAAQELVKDPKQKRAAAKDIYDRVIRLWPDYARNTLQQMAYVARSVPPSVRNPKLSFEHHRYVATLDDEPNARDLQQTFLQRAIELDASAEELRLMVSDTRAGRVMRGSTNAQSAHESDDPSDEREPEVLAGSHAQLAADAHRALARLRNWYAREQRRSPVSAWTSQRVSALLRDFGPLIAEMELVVGIREELQRQIEQ